MTRLTPRQLLPLTALVVLSGLAAGPAAADSPGSHPNFAQEFHAARIVSVVTVTAAASDGSATLATQEVLKGEAAALRTYPADDKAIDLTVGTKVVLLQGGETLDFRGTWALPVADNGTLDARGLPGAPSTLAALEAFAALPDTSTVSDAPTSEAPPAVILLVAGFGLLAIAALWFRAARSSASALTALRPTMERPRAHARGLSSSCPGCPRARFSSRVTDNGRADRWRRRWMPEPR